MHTALQILLVQSGAMDAELATAQLEAGVDAAQVTWVASQSEALARLSTHDLDLIVTDLCLPDAAGLQTLQALRAGCPRPLPVIVLTDLVDDDVAQRALVEGAQDYLTRSDLTPGQLARSVRYALARHQAEEEARLSRTWAQSVLDAIEAPTCVLDETGVIVATNESWRRSALENGGRLDRCGTGTNYLTVTEASGEPEATEFAAGLRQLLATGAGRIEFDYTCHGPERRRWCTLQATTVTGGRAVVVTHVDVTALKQAHEDLDHAASHDPLTGLANRRLLLHDLTARLASPSDRAVAVLFLDVDRLRMVNDNLGHTAGDALLVRVAAEITGAVRAGDLVARHGADEFVVVGGVSGEAEANMLAHRLQAAVSQPMFIDDCEVDVSASIGIVVSDGCLDDAYGLLQAADAAMRDAKQSGHGRFALYSRDLRERARDRAQLYRELIAAVDRAEFVLHYQPVVALADGTVVGVEALVRWLHPTRGLLHPADFIEVAESTGLIVPIGERVIEAAFEQGRRWQDEGLGLTVAVNLSARQLNDPRTIDFLEGALASSGFAPTSVVIEVTETTMLDDSDASIASMRAVRALGVRLAVDDFGTGYSSLAYLRRYPVDILKVDRSFVRDMATNPDDSAIVASVIRLARDLELAVVAEGVETPEQLAALRRLGCDHVQGFLFSRPLPAADVPSAVAFIVATGVHPLAGTDDGGALEALPPRRRRRQDLEVDAAAERRITELHAHGSSLHTIAAALNAEGLRAPHGLRWHARSVARVLSAGLAAGRSAGAR